MNFLTKSLTYVMCASILILSGCKRMEFDKIISGVWNPNLAVPLAHAKFNIHDILTKSDTTGLSTVDPITGAIALIYSEEVSSINAESFIVLENVNQSKVIELSELNAIPVPTFIGTINSTNNEILPINAGGAEIHQLEIKSGSLDLNISSNLAHDLTCEITFPEMKINGVPVTKTISLNYTGTVPQSSTGTINLAGAISDYTRGNTTFNELEAIISITITGTGQPIVGSENISFNFGFNDIRFKNVIGYFGQNNLGVPSDTILMEIFKNTQAGYFELVNPKIRFIVDNSFGFPIEVNLNNLKTIDIEHGTENPLTGYPSIFNIARPSSMGLSVSSQFELNTSNTGNLSTVISSVPKAFVFSIMAMPNPAGNVLPLNFITDSSKLGIRTEIELPMEGLMYGFEMKDTVNFSFNEDVSKLESIMFRLNVDNGFPIDLKAQIVFLDENYLPIFTIFNTPEALVDAALVDAAGRVNKHSKKVTDILLTPPQIALLPKSKYILINSIIETLDGKNGQIVKLYDEYGVDLKLGLQVQVKVN